MSKSDIEMPDLSGRLAIVTGASDGLVYTATPGTPSHGNLALLTVIGEQPFSPG